MANNDDYREQFYNAYTRHRRSIEAKSRVSLVECAEPSRQLKIVFKLIGEYSIECLVTTKKEGVIKVVRNCMPRKGTVLCEVQCRDVEACVLFDAVRASFAPINRCSYAEDIQAGMVALEQVWRGASGASLEWRVSPLTFW